MTVTVGAPEPLELPSALHDAPISHSPLHYPVTSAEQVVALYKERLEARADILAKARLVQTAVNGDLVIPLPEVAEQEKPSVANLARQNLDQLSRRVASVTPSIYFPSLRPGRSTSDTRARKRQQVMSGILARNKLKRRIGQRARYLLAYSTAPVEIIPDKQLGHARWICLDPLNTFPAEDPYDDHVPADSISASVYSYAALMQMFGEEAVSKVSKPHGWNHTEPHCRTNLDTPFDVLKYTDSYESSLVLVGQDAASDHPHLRDPTYSPPPEARHVLLNHAINYARRPLVIHPTGLALDKQLGHFYGMIGMYEAQSALMSLTLIAQRRAVFPREWFVQAPDASHAEIVTIPRPEEGKPGQVVGGSIVPQTLDPAYSTGEIMDRLEHGQRMETSTPAEFGGMSQSDNVRTGRRGQQVMGAAIDFTLAEIQDTFAESLVEENKAAIAVDLNYFDRPKKFFVPTRAVAGEVSYTPSDIWETDEHIVDYPIAGSDMQNLPIEGGQRIAQGTLSHSSFMEIDPLVKDAEAEKRRIQEEHLEQAFFTMVNQMASDPASSPFQPSELVKLTRYIHEEPSFIEAFERLHAEMQEQQATPAEDPAQMQPGMDQPGMGTQQPAPEGAGGGGIGSLEELSGVLGQLGTVGQAQHFRGGAGP